MVAGGMELSDSIASPGQFTSAEGPMVVAKLGVSNFTHSMGDRETRRLHHGPDECDPT
jgi:hypothetical protein